MTRAAPSRHAGTSTLWPSSSYTTDLPVGPKARIGLLYPNYATPYPVARQMPNAVVVRVVVGYGASSASVPSTITTCMKEHVRASYGRGAEDREEIMEWIEGNLWSYKAF